MHGKKKETKCKLKFGEAVIHLIKDIKKIVRRPKCIQNGEADWTI